MTFRVGLAAYRLLIPSKRPLSGFLRNMHYANAYALSKYVPETYPGAAVLFRVVDLRPDAPQMGWANLITGGLDILDSPYHHRGVQAESTARLMAQQLQAQLGKCAG